VFSFFQKVHQLIDNLKKLDHSIYYYPDTSLHMTIKNLRTVANPPNFDEQVIEQAKTIFSRVVSQHHAFQAYYYRLLLFPNNLALVGTTDEELDKIIFDLDRALIEAGIPDNKVYINDKYFFRIGVDGGVNKKNIGRLKEAGVDIFYCTSAIFDGEIESNYKELKNEIEK